MTSTCGAHPPIFVGAELYTKQIFFSSCVLLLLLVNTAYEGSFHPCPGVRLCTASIQMYWFEPLTKELEFHCSHLAYVHIFSVDVLTAQGP